MSEFEEFKAILKIVPTDALTAIREPQKI